MEEALDSPNGSVNLLAQSLRDVIAESQIVVLDAMKPELDTLQNAVADDNEGHGRASERKHQRTNQYCEREYAGAVWCCA